MTRPSRLTPTVHAVIVARTCRGGALAHAVEALGLRLKTVEGWLTRGRRESAGPCFDLARAVDEARAAHEAELERVTAEILDGHDV
jgi:hypothetical protein